MKFVTLVLSSLLLVACGGGGGASSSVVPAGPVAATTTTFALKQAYANDFLDTKPYSFAVCGNVTFTVDNPPSSTSGSISGTGSINQSGVTASTFDGVAAQAKSKTPSGTITVTTANGASAPQALPTIPTTVNVSGAFDLIGFTTPAAVVTGVSIPASFAAAAAPILIPVSARVGDVGTAGVVNSYATPAKGAISVPRRSPMGWKQARPRPQSCD